MINATMNIRMVPLHQIRPYENNVKVHPIKQLQSIVESIRQFGFRQPIVIDKNNVIVAGHARYEAAATLGCADVPCERADDLTEEQINAYRILDNEIAKQGTTDFAALNIEMAKLPDFDFKPFNLDIPKIEQVKEGLCDADDVPAITVNPKTKMGDLWLLGEHRLMCGDSTMIDQVEKLMDGNTPIAMITDPPYGVNYDPEWRDKSSLGVGERSLGKVENDDKIDWTDAYTLFTGNVVYVWHAGKFTHTVAKNLIDCGFDIISQIIWAKNNFAISRGDYQWKHEPCWYAVKRGSKHNWQGARDQSTLWEIKSTHQTEENSKVGHGTQKPVECMSRPILNNTSHGDWIYDPFGGSGTTLIAAEKHNRKCLMMEISPAYCDVIINRWQKFTGKEAILEGSDLKFNEVPNG